MALNSFLTLEAQTQGAIEGSCDISGHEKSLEIYGWSHEVISPRDAASGLPTGKRQHKPFSITKPIDQSSPLLMFVLVRNENIPKWELKMYHPDQTGDEVHFYTVNLENANIAGIRMEQLNNKYPENMKHEIREHVSFTYQTITWTHVTASKTATDNWKAPAQA